MKIKRVIIPTLIVLLFNACTDNMKGYFYEDTCDYSNCNTEEPFYAQINVWFSRTGQTPNPYIYVFSGDFENGIIIDTIKTDTLENYIFATQIWVPVDFYYSLAAEFLVDNDTIWVVDGNFVYKKSRKVCDSICWTVNDKDFNLRLKY